ncbi:MAG: hypothetical protein VKL59_08245 [Nostocaceae cyanobacterium]|nr:hypothetical protein [Nostocaceae cyanobacterium]
MEHWEFLIQKQGERTWVPLLSPTADIVEGRYRVVARSSRANTNVEVRVIYSSTLEVPPKRRIQKRTRRTNSEGLMVVIPFTNLKPGCWELRCSGDLMSDFMGESWQQLVKLDVLPKIPQAVTVEQHQTQVITPPPVGTSSQTAKPEIPPSPVISTPPVAPIINLTPTTELPPPVITPPLTDAQIAPEPATTLPSETPEIEVEITPQLLEVAVNPADPVANPVWLQGKTAEQILEALLEIALPEEEPIQLPDAEKPLTPPIAPAALPPLQLTLDREIYVARWGESVNITGVVELAEHPEPTNNHTNNHSEPLLTLLNGELLIELRNPQRSQILAQAREPFPEQLLPSVFMSSIAIPADCQSKLILADISLYGCLEGATQATLLAVESFTITADVSELMEAISQQALLQELESPDPPLQEPPVFPDSEELEEDIIPIDLEFFHLAKQTKPIAPISLQPTPKAGLPPKLEPRSPAPPPNPRSPRLPWLPKEPEDIDNNTEETGDDSPETTASEEKQDALVPLDKGESEAAIVSALDAPEEIVLDVDGESVIIPATPQEQVELAFESLHLEQRFWTRLNALAEDNQTPLTTDDTADETSEGTEETPPSALPGLEESNTETSTPELSNNEDEQTAAAPSEQTTAESAQPPIASPPARHTWKAIDWLAQEVVVDDTPQEPEPKFYKRRPKPQPEQPPAPDLSDLMSKTAHPLQSLPTPQLQVPQVELISGQPLQLLIELATERPNLAIKLWIEDYQTRSLLDGPHWLFDLTPTDAGTLEVTTQLTVPMGCLEIRIEAIAVHLPTQNESHKVSIERSVIPPDLPDFPNLSLDDLLDG